MHEAFEGKKKTPHSSFAHIWLDPLDTCIFSVGHVCLIIYNSLKPVQLQTLLAEAGVSSGGLWLTATCWPWPDSTTIQATPAIITGGILILSQAVFSFHWEDLQTDFTAVTTQRDSAPGSHWGKWTVDHVKVPLSFCLLLSKKDSTSLKVK